jgi:hypothetical protein
MMPHIDAGRYKIPHRSIVRKVGEALAEYEPYILSASGSSVYLKFKSVPHQLRISNHPERARYGSMWQLRLDWDGQGEAPWCRERKSHSKFFHRWEDLVREFKTHYSGFAARMYG